VTFTLLPLSDISRFLDVLPIDSVEPKVFQGCSLRRCFLLLTPTFFRSFHVLFDALIRRFANVRARAKDRKVRAKVDRIEVF
jgi:hypothetical protein